MTRPKAWDAQGYDADFGFVSGSAGGVLEWLAPQPGMRILDLGCGTGELLAELLEAGTDAVGLDADPAMVERAQRRVGADRVRRLDAQSFGLVDAFGLPFDAVFSNAALHWMHRPADVIASVREVLRPGGRFVAEMGAGRNMATIVAALRQARAANGWTGDVATPWYFPTPAEYASLLEGGGLELRRLAYFPRRTLLSDERQPDRAVGGDVRHRDGGRPAGRRAGRGPRRAARTDPRRAVPRRPLVRRLLAAAVRGDLLTGPRVIRPCVIRPRLIRPRVIRPHVIGPRVIRPRGPHRSG